MATSAMYVEFIDMYSTDHFIMALRQFMGAKGTLTRIQSDQGEIKNRTSRESSDGLAEKG
jgi:hypothetical protein